ncbi:MAG TPA: hypothetical protein VGH80_07660 [Xanthomonadaceae bacterium]
MGTKIAGIVLILFGLLLGAGYYEQVFRHGWNEGLSRAEEFRPQETTWAVGSVFAIAIGLGAFVRKKKK